jgi:CheY-like chemotaxis protein
MKASPQTAGIPVIVITALPERTVTERLQGYEALLRKPFREKDLLEAVHKVLGPSAWTRRCGLTSTNFRRSSKQLIEI